MLPEGVGGLEEPSDGVLCRECKSVKLRRARSERQQSWGDGVGAACDSRPSAELLLCTCRLPVGRGAPLRASEVWHGEGCLSDPAPFPQYGCRLES